MRASDQRRPPAERILDDPFARRFLGPGLRAALATLEATGDLGERAERLFPSLTAFILTRHRFIDDALARALAPGSPIEQVVVLGAGYDSRAQRFAEALAGRRVFEVDHPATARRKRAILARRGSDLPAVAVERVDIDFQTQAIDERLLAAGFRAGVPSFFTWEGVSPYLTRDAVKSTFRLVREIAGSGSRIAADFWFLLDRPDAVATALRTSSQLLSLLGEPVTFGIHPEDLGAFLQRLGWELDDLADAAELQRRYVRDARSVYPASYVALARAG